MTKAIQLPLTLTIEEWAKLTGLRVLAIKWRLSHGWTIKEALTIPADANLIEFNGEALRITDWSRRLGVSTSAIRMRLNLGWSVAEALSTPTMKRGQKRKGRKRKPGVVSDFVDVSATGAPRLARDISQLEISK